MNYELLLAITTVLYLSQIGVFLLGLRRAPRRGNNREQLLVSVIVAARNEERSIGQCIASLQAQTYPRHCYEIVVVDDSSDDGTRALCENLAAGDPHLRVIPAAVQTQLRGKVNALATGIKESRGELIIITDADCVVPPTWIESTVSFYEPGVGIVGGMALQQATNAFTGMQSLDWAFLLGIAAAGVGLKNPLSTIGNNLSFRRAAYQQVGGYEGIPFSITEDYSLFQAIVRTGRWRYAYPVDDSLLVMSTPCRSWKDLLRQKHRWGKGGLDMKLSGFLIMAVGFVQHLMILAGAPLYGAVSAALTGWFLKAVGDYVFLHSVLGRLGRLQHLRFFHAFQVYFLFYVLILPFIVFFRKKVVWKGREY